MASKRCHLFEETECSTWVNRSWYNHYLNAARGYTHYIHLSTTKLRVSMANRISLILCFKKKTKPKPKTTSKCWLSQSHLFWHSESNCFVITTCHCCYRFVGENENWNQWILPYSNGREIKKRRKLRRFLSAVSRLCWVQQKHYPLGKKCILPHFPMQMGFCPISGWKSWENLLQPHWLL